MDLSLRTGNRVVDRIKSNGEPGEPYNRPRPVDALSTEYESDSYKKGGYSNGKYYYDIEGTTNVTKNLKGSTSYPSGHTGYGWNAGLVWCTMFSEFAESENTGDLEKMFNRAFKYGESRVILGAHWQYCVDMGRIAAACGFAMMCANKYFIEQVDYAQNET